jgi:hypothetical protein
VADPFRVPEPARVKPLRNRWGIIALVALPLLLAALIYHPWRVLPLDFWDFPEFIPVLDRTHGGWAQWGALIEYYASHGRSNPVFYGTFVLQYHWFGADALGWQLLRYAWMALDVGLVVAIGRRLGLGWFAAVAASALLAGSTPAVRAWVQLMAEPQALATLLLALFLALRYQSCVRWRVHAAAIIALLAAAFLTKEIVGTLGAVVVLAGVLHGRTAGTPLLSKRNLVLGVGALLVAVGVAVMLLEVRARPDATGYGMQYGMGRLTLAHFGRTAAAITVPVQPAELSWLALLYPTNTLVVLVLVFGAVTALRRREGARRLLPTLAWVSLPVLLGALVYWPWPKFDSFYALPFFVGPVLLYAAALDRLIAGPPAARWFGLAAGLLAPLYTAIPASRSTETAAASLRLNADLARLIGRLAPGDTILVLSPEEGPHVLPVQADEFRRYVRALHLVADADRGPAIVRAPCQALNPAAVRGGPLVFATFSYGCGRLPQPALRLVSRFTWRDWLTLSARPDSMAVDLVGDAVARMRSSAPP